MKHYGHLATKKVAIISTFASLYYVLSFLPGIKVAAGGASISIQIEAFMASIFGLIFGPYLGALTAFLGAFVAWVLPPGTPSPTSAVFLPAPAMNAFLVGQIYKGRWKIAFITLATTILVFWLLPPTQPLDQYSYIGLYAMWDKILALALIPVSAILTIRMRKDFKEASSNVGKAIVIEKIDAAFILSFFASILILANAWLIFLSGNTKFQFDILGASFRFNLVSKELSHMISHPYIYLWLLLGFVILNCTFMLLIKSEKRAFFGGLISIASCLSVVFGGGFFIGVFSGVLGGIFTTFKKKFALPRITIFEDVLLYFLLAFIGNEADNALGADIFALPFIYEGIFQIPNIEVLRLSFTIAPFLYFAIRLLQAVITTLIATPLMRSLRTSGLDLSRLSGEYG